MSDELDSFPPMHPNIQGIGRERARKAQQGAESVPPPQVQIGPSAQPDTDPDLLAAPRFASAPLLSRSPVQWMENPARLLLVIGASVALLIVLITGSLFVAAKWQHPGGRQATTTRHSATRTPTGTGQQGQPAAGAPTQSTTQASTTPTSATPSSQDTPVPGAPKPTLVPGAPKPTLVPGAPTPTSTPVPPTPTPTPVPPTPTFTSNPPKPQAYMENAGGYNLTGWACDGANGDRTSQVDFYADYPYGVAGTVYLGGVWASDNHPDLVTAGVCGSTPNHGFFFNTNTSRLLTDNNKHTIWAYNKVNGTITVVGNSGGFTVPN